jgi:hypothetical protein
MFLSAVCANCHRSELIPAGDSPFALGDPPFAPGSIQEVCCPECGAALVTLQQPGYRSLPLTHLFVQPLSELPAVKLQQSEEESRPLWRAKFLGSPPKSVR